MRATTLLLFLPALSAAQVPPDFDKTVERAMATFHIPGVSIAIVRDGKVVLAKGYGVSDLVKQSKVDDRTLFGIASNTKAFTATALAVLVDDGKVHWDDRVTKVLPAFKLSDPYVTSELTIKDLLVHRSGLGLGAGDLLIWPSTTYTPSEVIERLQYVPLATSFRYSYAYDNVLYLVAGAAIESISGGYWSSFVNSRILKPLGMDDTQTTHDGALKSGRLASTYGWVDGKLEALAPYTSDVVSPAGGIYSNANDLAQWMLVRLNRGALSSGRLYSAQRARDLITPVTPIPIGEIPEDFKDVGETYESYALGVGVQDYRGRQLISHTGGLPGFYSVISLLPGSNSGIAILTNAQSGSGMNAIRNAFLDFVAGASGKDWVDVYAKIDARNEAMLQRLKAGAAAKQDAASKPHLPLAGYAGDYEDPWYGRVSLTEKDGKLNIQFGHTPLLVGTLVHWQYETFLVRWTDRTLLADAYITFTMSPSGKVTEARILPASPEVDFSYDYQDLRLRKVGS